VEVAEQNEALLAIQDVVRTHLLSKYVATVTSKAYQERSSILKGFILDLNEKLGESGIETLGLADDITALEDANNAFIAAYAQRTAEKAEGSMGVTARLRDEMYDLYLQVIYTVQYLANSTDEANAEKATACQTFIGVLNVLLADAKRRYNQRISNGTGEEGEGEGGEGGNTNPDDSSNTIPDDEGGEGGSSSGSGSDNSGSGSNTGNTDNSGSGSGSGNSNTGTDNSGSGNSGSGSGSGSNSGSGSGDNTTDPNQPSESGVVNGDEVSF
jgi:hypothetical protein